MKMDLYRMWLLAVSVASLATFAETANGEPRISEVDVECGDIVEGEFTVAIERHDYKIRMGPGDQIDAFVAPVGDFLNFRARVLEPAGNEIFAEPSWNTGTVKAPVIKTGVLSGRGEYRLEIQNHDAYERPGNLGVYTFHVGCKLRSGREIQPGESQSDSRSAGDPESGATALPKISFPKFSLSGPVEGTITTSGDQAFGFRFGAEQGDEIQLRYFRQSGTLGLILVLFDDHERVIFRTIMTDTKDSLSRMTLPASGDYTVAVSRLRKTGFPSSPEDTTFTIDIQSISPKAKQPSSD